MNTERAVGWNRARRAARAVALLVCCAAQCALGGAAPATIEPAAATAVKRQADTPAGVLDVLAHNRAQGVPNYVTVDVLLVAREDLAVRAQKALERDTLGVLRKWIRALGVPVPDAANAPVGEAAARVDDLAALLAVLAGDRAAATLSPRAAAEHALVLKAGGLAASPLWMTRIDYSQLVPRGYYADDGDLARYFVLARYLGTVLFHARVSEATGATDAIVRAQMEALQDIARRVPDAAQYDALLRPAAAAGGQADDLSLRDVWAIAQVHEPLALADALYRRAVETKRQPRVLAGYVDLDRLRQDETAADALTGVRLLPGVATWDAILFQRLVNEAGRYTGKDSKLPFSAARAGAGIEKGYPRADELLAVLGSKPAAERLRLSGDTAYAYYAALLRTLQQEQAAQPGAGDAALLAALIAAPDSAQDETARAAWTLTRHRQLLHAKQSYTTVSRAMRIDGRETAAIEPASAAFAAIASDARTRAASAAGEVAEDWKRFAALADRCRELAEASAAGKPLAADAIDFLNGIDQALAALGVTPDRPVVADVHTHPSESQVVEEATAWPRRVETPCGETVCLGAKLSHREFKQPIDARLTDAQWRKQLQAESKSRGKPPT